MENRFGVKDFFLFLVMALLIVLVVLGMFQYDRQWVVIQQTNRQVMELTGDVASIRRQIEQGGAVSTGMPLTPSIAMAGFDRVLKSHAQPDYAEGDSLVQVFPVVPDKLTPVISSDEYSQIVQLEVMDQLAINDLDTLKWIPRVAESWKISDDQLSIDVKIRKGITFSDGTPLTADDIVFTFQFPMNMAIEAPRERSALDRLSHVDKVNDYEVNFVFKEAYFASFDLVALQPIMSKAFYSKIPATDFNRSTGLLIGSGPYRLPDPTTWKPEPGKPIVLVRNERYWGPRPSFNKMIYKVVENATARATAFNNGEVDVFGPGIIGPTPEQYDKMVADPALSARTTHFALDQLAIGYYYIGWNEKIKRDGPPSLFADARVRQALTMLINRELLIKDVMRGYATLSTGPFSPLSEQCDTSIKPWPYDPVAANKLLAEAGFKRNGDQLMTPAGKPFEFKLTYGTHSDIARRMVPMIKDSLAEAGILLDPDPQEWSVMIKRLNDREVDATLMGWGGVIHDDIYQIFDSSQIAGTGDDYIQYSSKETDAAIEAARGTLDHDKGMALWHQVCDILHRDQPYTFLYAEKELTFLDSRIRGAAATARLGINTPDEWYVPKNLQKYTE